MRGPPFVGRLPDGVISATFISSQSSPAAGASSTRQSASTRYVSYVFQREDRGSEQGCGKSHGLDASIILSQNPSPISRRFSFGWRSPLFGRIVRDTRFVFSAFRIQYAGPWRHDCFQRFSCDAFPFPLKILLCPAEFCKTLLEYERLANSLSSFNAVHAFSVLTPYRLNGILMLYAIRLFPNIGLQKKKKKHQSDSRYTQAEKRTNKEIVGFGGSSRRRFC